MPRPKPVRQVNHERHLARRIAEERERADWSMERLAQRMTEAGCAMDKSAIYRIESGNPPRRITLDEAVTFANVFKLNLNDLLLPTSVARNNEAKRLWRQYLSLKEKQRSLHEQTMSVMAELLSVVDEGYREEVDAAARSLDVEFDSEQLDLLWRMLRDEPTPDAD